MIEFNKVLGAFSILADIDTDEAYKNAPIVHLAIAEIGSMLKSGAVNNSTHDRVCHACAAVAYHKYSLVKATRDSAFSVGDVKFTPLQASEIALSKQLKDDAMGSIADLTEPIEFAFLKV